MILCLFSLKLFILTFLYEGIDSQAIGENFSKIPHKNIFTEKKRGGGEGGELSFRKQEVRNFCFSVNYLQLNAQKYYMYNAWTLEARSIDTGRLQRCCLPLQGDNSCIQSLIRIQADQYSEGYKKGFSKYLNSKWKIRNNISPLLDEVSHFTNRDAKQRCLMPSSDLSPMTDPGDSQKPVLEDHDWLVQLRKEKTKG